MLLKSFEFLSVASFLVVSSIASATCSKAMLGLRNDGDKGIGYTASMTPAPPFLCDHLVGGRVIVPAAAFVSNSLAAAKELISSTEPVVRLTGFQVRKPLDLSDSTQDATCVLLTVLDVPNIHCVSQIGEERTIHSRAKVSASAAFPLDFSRFRINASRAIAISPVEAYDFLLGTGLRYGPGFRILDSIWTFDTVAMGRVSLHPGVPNEPHYLSPTLIDASFHLMAAMVVGDRKSDANRAAEEPKVAIPIHFEEIYWRPAISHTGHARAWLSLRESPRPDAQNIEYDLLLTDHLARPFFLVVGGRFAVVKPSQLIQ